MATDNNFGDMLTGFAGGVLGSVAGLSGALPTIWSSLHGWNKYEQRALLQPFNVIILGIVLLCCFIKTQFMINFYLRFSFRSRFQF